MAVKKAVRREAKKYARKNPGFIIALILCLILGLALGFGILKIIDHKDEFSLYNGGEKMQTATVNLASGETYDVNSDENAAKVVVWGVDVSSYVKTTIKYVNEEKGEVEIVTDFSKDGTYCIIYELDYTGDNFLVNFGKAKYENVKLRKTVIIGGNE
ncbi:MAG: hypothetical protein J6C23_00655 [Clostridia bacterium]|nr:hypothetical protein [Clostridia bacterium]